MDGTKYEYRPGRFLLPGDVFRATGGPVIKCGSGRTYRFGPKSGVFKFHEIERDDQGNVTVICFRTTARHTESVRLVVHRAESAAPIVDGLEYRPYKIVKKNDPGKAAPKQSAPPSYVC